MMRSRPNFNPKRRIQSNCESDDLTKLEKKVTYGGNPAHKRNPGNFALVPPAQPRADKTLCDEVNVFERSLAIKLLRKGVQLGLISEQMRGEFPQNIWSFTASGQPLEAALTILTQGVYHGYPMPITDPFRTEILSRYTGS